MATQQQTFVGRVTAGGLTVGSTYTASGTTFIVVAEVREAVQSGDSQTASTPVSKAPTVASKHSV
jgi:hypothetical protein